VSEDEATRARLAAIGEIAAEIAHELRNVLQVIAASSYLARQPNTDTTPHLEKIDRNARLAQNIVDDLMALARGEVHTEALYVGEALVAAREGLPLGAAEFEDELEPALRAFAHLGLMSRLLHVLYENSVAVAAPAAPKIVTRGYREGERVVLEVQDDGPGVPPDIAPRIFDPLVSRRPGGSGLGLALAKRIAAASGGSIALVPSERGALFRVDLRGTG
jgi:signal transduction histidine kinase